MVYRNGSPLITTVGDNVSYGYIQSLSEDEKSRARKNIDASKIDDTSASEDYSYSSSKCENRFIPKSVTFQTITTSSFTATGFGFFTTYFRTAGAAYGNIKVGNNEMFWQADGDSRINISSFINAGQTLTITAESGTINEYRTKVEYFN